MLRSSRKQSTLQAAMGSDSKPAMAPYRQRWAATSSQKAEASKLRLMTLPTTMIILR